MGIARRGNESFSAENLQAFVDEYLLSNDEAKAYAKVFRTRGAEYNRERGGGLVARADVQELLRLGRERRQAELLGLDFAPEEAENGGEFGVEEQMRLLRELARDKGVAAGQRIQAITKYAELEERVNRTAEEERIPEELGAFLSELRSNYA